MMVLQGVPTSYVLKIVLEGFEVKIEFNAADFEAF